MKLSSKDIALKVLKYSLFPSDAVVDLYQAIERSVQQTQDVAESGDLERMIRIEASQEVEMRMAERQAKVTQELAIADRIRTAQEVEIEEYYDLSGEGSLGLNLTETGGTLGASGKGNKVVKRIFRFTGVRELNRQELNSLTDGIDSDSA